MPPSTTSAAARVLGPITIHATEKLGAMSANAVLSLALARAHTRTVEALIEDVWPDSPPAGARQALHTMISRLRSRAGAQIETVPGGYRLAAGAATDLQLAEEAAARSRLAEAGEAIAIARAALDLWREPVGGGATNEALLAELASRARRARRDLVLLAAEGLLQAGDPEAALAQVAGEEATGDEQATAITMKALAQLGRLADAADTFARHRAALADSLGTDPSPALAELNTELLRSATAPASRGPVRVGLRRPATTLLGREDDLAALGDLVATHRVVSIVGAGGLGKTRLAFELASRFEHNVVAVELAGIGAGDDVARAVASALSDIGGPWARGSRPDASAGSLEKIAATLGRGRWLLLLDNCEHVVAAASRLVAGLLARTGELTIVTTTRKALGLAGEQVYVPAPLPSLMAGGAAGPAAELFIERARAVRPAAALPLAQVAALTERLDGLPLAIELAAARIRSMSIEEISRRLADRFALLTIGDPSAPTRHRTLRAVIDWSWDLLTASQRELGRRLSGFTGSFDADGALALAGSRGATEVIDDLDALVSHSLLKAFDSPHARGTRYLMVQTVHEYCAEQAAEQGETDAIRAALFAWGRDLAHQMLRIMTTPGAPPLSVSLHEEEDNVVALLRAALAARDVATVLAVFGASGMWWTVQGSITESVALSEDVLSLVAADGVPPGSEEDGALAGALIAFTQGFWADAPRHLDADPLVRALLDSPAPIAPSIRFLGELVLHRDQEQALSELSARARLDGDPAVRALATMLVATFAENAGQIEHAIDVGRAAYEIAAAERLSWIRAITAQLVAGLYSEAGDPAHALEWIAIARADLDWVGGAVNSQDLIQIEALGALARGDLDAAREAIGRWAPGPNDRQPETTLMMRSAAAEIELAAGNAAGAVAQYDAVAGELGAQVDHLEPWWLVTMSARVVVRIRAGLADDGVTGAIVSELRDAVARSPQTSTDRADFPVTGTVALAFAVWYGHTAPASLAGPLLFVLAEYLRSRQDIPSMSRAAAAAHLPAQDVAAARATVAPMSPRARLTLALAIMADPAAATA